MDIYKKALSEEISLSGEISDISARLSKLPKGTLVIHRNSSKKPSFKWYLREQDNCTGKYSRKYIPKKDRTYAAALAERTILTHRLIDVKKKHEAIKSFLKRYPTISQAHLLLEKSPGFQELLLSTPADIPAALLEWQNYPYESNQLFPENKNIRTLRGEMVRSKAEAMIANVLFRRGIVYRYDCALHLGNTVIFPDFILIRPGASIPSPSYVLSDKDVNRILVIEHNGLMDKQKYVNHVKYKSGLYYDFGFIPSKNLIMTFETEAFPFDLNYFTKELDYYFE